MADNPLTLFCLVDGESLISAFPVEIKSSKTIGDLKDLIKAKNPETFIGVDAKDLALWRVSIPISDEDNDDLPVLLDKVLVKDKKRLGAATRLSRIFHEDLLDGTVHVIVQRPSRGVVSESGFVQFVPSAVVGVNQTSGVATSRSPVSVTPASVLTWDGFLDSVRNQPLDRTPHYCPPRFWDIRHFEKEEALHGLFQCDVGSVRVLPPFATTEMIMGLEYGSPDLVCLKKGGDTTKRESILFPIEMKRPVILESEDLVADYNNQVQAGQATDVVCSVQQEYGYLWCNGYRYGILSSYEQTWFAKRDGADFQELLVSPPIRFDQTEPTLLQCYLWFVRQASADQNSLLKLPLTVQVEAILKKEQERNAKQSDKDPSYQPPKKQSGLGLIKIPFTRSRSKKTTRVVLPAYDILGPISYNEEGASIVKALWKGYEVVVKKCDIYNQHAVVAELEHEAMIYEELQELQGECIPTLWIAGVANGLEMIVVTEFVGTNISQERLDDSDRAQIRHALCTIHHLGVAHGDIRLENIVVQRNDLCARFFFIDFGMSYTTKDKEKLSYEMRQLDLLLSLQVRDR